MSEEDLGKSDDSEEVVEEEAEEELVENMADSSSIQELRIVEVHGDDRILCDILTQTEYTSIVCTRADQIQNGAPFFTDVPSMNPNVILQIGKNEILEGNCPLSIRRVVSTFGNVQIVEIWDVSELKIIPKNLDNFEDLSKGNVKVPTLAEEFNSL